jgi:hypothetical protein
MKKVLIMILGITLFAGSAMAEGEVSSKNYTIKPVVNVATFEDADTTTGVGIAGSVEDLVLVNTKVAGGVNFYDLGTADLYRFPVTVGYDFDINDTVTVTPNVGIVTDVVDADKADAEYSVGFTGGVDTAFKVNDSLDITVGVAYVANTVEDANANLDGFTFTGGAAYRF